MVSYQRYYAAPAQPSPPSLDMPYYGISFTDAIKRGFKKYATFRGEPAVASTGGGRCSPSSSTLCCAYRPMYSVSRPHRMAAALLAPQLYR